MSKKTREALLISFAIAIAFCVWWANLYSPRQERLEEVNTQLALADQKKLRLINRIERFSKGGGGSPEEKMELSLLAKLLPEGETMEAVNASTQLYLQEFIEKHDVTFRSYKELTPAKWRKFELGRLQFQLNSSTRGLSDLLAYFDDLEKVIRVERLTVNYRRSKEKELMVTLHLGTLFVGESAK